MLLILTEKVSFLLLRRCQEHQDMSVALIGDIVLHGQKMSGVGFQVKGSYMILFVSGWSNMEAVQVKAVLRYKKRECFPNDIINQFLVFVRNKTMIGQDSSFLQHLKLQKEARKLEMMLIQRTEQLHDRDTLIKELQNTIDHLTASLSTRSPTKSAKEETQCSFEEEKQEMMRNFREVLSAREQEGVSLHMLSQEKQEENAELRAKLTLTQEQLNESRKKVQSMEGFLEVSMSDFDYLCQENKKLRDKITRYETQKSQLEKRVVELQAESEQWQSLKQEKLAVMQERLKMQGEEHLSMKEVEQQLREELLMQTDEAERNRAVLNNYQWKLFCLETQLDLCNKDRKQLKFMAQKHELQQSKLEHSLKEKRIEIFSWEEESRMLNSENRYLAAEVKSKGDIIEQLQAEVARLRHDMQEHEQFKEMTYSLKEKDDQMSQIMAYLKEKIGELDQAKNKITDLEKQLQEKNEDIDKLNEDRDKMMEENYDLEQTLIDQEALLDQKNLKEQETKKGLEAVRKQLQDNSMLEMLRSSEWNEIRNSLESTISEQSQKINQLSVEIIQRDIAAKKSAEQLTNSENKLHKYNKQLQYLYMRLQQTQKEMTTLIDMRASREDQLDKTIRKLTMLEQSIKEKEKIINVLQAELKNIKSENANISKINGEYEEKIYLKEEEISTLREKVVDQIEEELNYEFKIQQVIKENNQLKAELTQKQKQQEVQEGLLENYRQQIKKLQEATQKRLQEITDLICPPEIEEETNKFEVLQQQFEVVEADFENKKEQIKAKLVQYNEELSGLASQLL